jgi:acyl-CoA thioesterase-1
MQDDRKKFGRWMEALRSPFVLFVLLALAFMLQTTSAYSASKTVLVLGDSLSAEYGLARGTGWVTLMENRLKAEKIDAAIVNASVSGETTSGGRARLPSLLEKHRPGVVIIELGGNDGLRGLPIAATESNLNAMITAAQNAKAQVLLVGMQIPPNYGRKYTEQFATMYSKIAKEKKTLLVPFLLEGIANQEQLFQGDRIHPTAGAQPIMLNNVWPHMKRLLLK